MTGQFVRKILRSSSASMVLRDGRDCGSVIRSSIPTFGKLLTALLCKLQQRDEDTVRIILEAG